VCAVYIYDSFSDVDFDEVAWELEKCLVYHFLKAKSQVCWKLLKNN